MTLIKALEALRDGKKICKKGSIVYYTMNEEGGIDMVMKLTHHVNNQHYLIVYGDDLDGRVNDYEVYEEK